MYLFIGVSTYPFQLRPFFNFCHIAHQCWQDTNLTNKTLTWLSWSVQVSFDILIGCCTFCLKNAFWNLFISSEPKVLISLGVHCCVHPFYISVVYQITGEIWTKTTAVTIGFINISIQIKETDFFYVPATKWPGHSVTHVCNSEIKQLSPLFFAMLWDIDMIFGIRVYNDELQIEFTFRSSSMIFGQVMVLGHWNLAKYLVVTPFLAHLTQRVMWAIVTTESPLTFHILIN